MKKLLIPLHKVLIILIVLSLTGQNVALASTTNQEGKPRVDYSDTTGKMVFIGADPNNPISIRSAQTPGISRNQSTLAMVSQYANEFGLRNPSNELSIVSEDQIDERNITHYQQVYQGIPVMAGELVVNATSSSQLVSISGEIAPDLSLNTTPTISSQQALQTAQEMIKKSYDANISDIIISTPELWVYDSRLLKPDGSSPILVWRMEAQVKESLPVNELILIDAKYGRVALHFNQVDTSWHNSGSGYTQTSEVKQENLTPTPTSTVSPTPEPPLDQPTTEPTSQPEFLPTPTSGIDEFLPTATPSSDGKDYSQNDKSAPIPQATVNYYVDITNGNNTNSCTAPASPCKNIQETINKISINSSAYIYITSGTYTKSTNTYPNVVVVNNGSGNLIMSGGWDSSFTAQSGVSIIDGQNTNNGYLQNSGIITLENFIIQNSTSSDSGGVYLVSGSLTIQKTTIKNNHAGNRGGGIFVSNGIVNLINSTISGNSATNGGGIYLTLNTSSTPAAITILNSTIVNNTASSQGGGITKANNANVTLINTILANNSASIGPDCNGTINSATNSIIENSSDCPISSETQILNVDPLLSISSSGLFQVFTPQISSPVFNSGTNIGCPSEDQTGTTRPQAGICDIGSIEMPSSESNTIYVYRGNNQSTEINTEYSSPIVALALNGSNQPMSGVEITFTAPSSGAGLSFSSTGTNTLSVTTDENGYATTSNIIANGNIGPFLITATSVGYSAANFQLTNIPSGNIYAYTGNNQSTNVNTAFPAPIVALVLSNTEEPVSGVEVTFTLPLDSASGIFSSTGTNIMTATSDANGFVSTSSVLANGTNGNYSISASASGYTPNTFQLTNTLSGNSNGRYVSKNGNDASNNCNSSITPCLTINNAVTNASPGDTIYITSESYTSENSGSNILAISKSLTISGGWNQSFSSQTGYTILDGQNSKQVLSINNSGGQVSLLHLIIQNGYSSNGGGISIYSGHVNIDKLFIRNNAASVYGGGVYIGSSNSNISVTNTIITNNSAQNTGGGVYISAPGSAISIKYSTLAYNNASANTGGIVRMAGVLNITSSIIANNFSKDCSGGINFIKYSIISNSTGCSVTTGTGVFLDTDPLISPPLEHGEIFLLPNSPAINHGESASCPTQDIAKKSRPIGVGCDIGAWEKAINSTGVVPVGVYFMPVINPTVLLSQNAIFNLQAMVVDQNFAPIPNINVTFTVPASGASGLFPNNLKTITVPTNEIGIAITSFSANEFPGTYAVQASITEVPGIKSISVKNSPSVITYTMNGSSDENLLPGNLICDSIRLDCSINPNAEYAQKYSIATYNFYYTQHGRKGLDDQNIPIISSVNFGTSYNNAYWSGEQVVYGIGFPSADDIVAHELTHAVTQYESNLFYYYQSGAINESLSDIWGEAFDQKNGYGNDATNVKWLIGEDKGGAIRNMSNPPAYGDPDKMTSPYYYIDSDDDGGVHQNSGINNKAAYLMVEGGTFNNKTVTPLGMDKTLAVYYEAQTNLLTSGSDYADLYNLLYQACVNLLNGSEGITIGDCQEVRDATDAVEMNYQPGTNYNSEASFCGVSGSYPLTTYKEDFENGLNNWVINNGTILRWQYDSPYGPFAHSGQHFLYGDDYPQNGTGTNAIAQWDKLLIPANAYLHFAHAYDFESTNGNNFDGGIIEYSVNGGGWVDAKPLIETNGYNGVLVNSSESLNPLKGRQGFIGSSHGYISTRLNLSTLAGKYVSFRWRMGLDQYIASLGWWVDDIRIYTCSTTPLTISGTTGASGETNIRYVENTLKTVSSNSDGSFSINVPPGWSGSITPTHSCFTFNPLSLSYNEINSKQINQNFTAIPISNSKCLLSINRKDSNPTAAHNVNFIVSFSEDVQGVEENDFTLVTPNLTGATITNVTSVSASIYIVSVNTGVGSGSVRIDVSNSATIQDLTNNNLNNLPFTFGEEYTILPSKPVIAPKLSLPKQNSTSNDPTPTFSWSHNNYDAEYEIQVASNSSFTNIVYSSTSAAPTYTPTTPLTDGKYFWRVRALNRDAQPGKYSSTQVFTIDTTSPLPPVLTSPLDAATLRSSPVFRWNKSSSAVLYEFQYDNDADFSSTSYSGTTKNTNIKPPAMPNGAFFWRVRAQDAAGNWSNWSLVRSVTINR